MDRSKTFLIVGLGLLGGKYAQVLSGKGYRVLGIDTDPDAVAYARRRDYIVEGLAGGDPAPLLAQADYVIFGLYPHRAAAVDGEPGDSFAPRDDGHRRDRRQNGAW